MLNKQCNCTEKHANNKTDKQNNHCQNKYAKQRREIIGKGNQSNPTGMTKIIFPHHLEYSNHLRCLRRQWRGDVGAAETLYKIDRHKTAAD